MIYRESYIQTVVGNGISEPSTVGGDFNFNGDLYPMFTKKNVQTSPHTIYTLKLGPN